VTDGRAGAVSRRQFIAREPGQRGNGHRDEVRHVTRCIRRLIASQAAGAGDAAMVPALAIPGQVLGPPV
jgi:hypothetical protein